MKHFIDFVKSMFSVSIQAECRFVNDVLHIGERKKDLFG